MSNEVVDVEIALDAGPRVTGFRAGGVDLFARLGDDGIALSGGRRFTFIGGHRLWVAPEDPAITYEPDDRPPEIAETSTGVRMRAPSGSMMKEIEVALDGTRAEIVHRLVNTAGTPVVAAPWAVTQLRPGGVVLMPLWRRPRDPHGLQAATSLVVWPYADLGDPGLRCRADLVLIDGNRSTPIKVGTPLRRGWLAYAAGSAVFVKRTSGGPTDVDLGASGQVYVDDRFAELETVGALTTLGPDECVVHTETWEMHRVSSPGPDPTDLVERLLLDG